MLSESGGSMTSASAGRLPATGPLATWEANSKFSCKPFWSQDSLALGSLWVRASSEPPADCFRLS